MRIGIDARELCGHATGAGRYLGGLLQQWAHAERARRHEFVLYAAEAVGFGLDAHRFATRLIAGPTGARWEQQRLPRTSAADHLDVFFSPAYSAPLASSVPTVIAIHDVSFLAHPEWFRTREGIRRRWLTRGSARRARAIVTISEFSRREIVEHLGVDEPRVHVIRPGVIDPTRGRPRRARGERVLFVGSIFNRRHVPDLVRAFGRLARRRPGASLDLVGDNRTYPYEDVSGAIAAERLDGRIRWHHYVPEDRLAELYGAARAFAFLSEYEGLGLTPLEALAAGVPAVMLDTPVARESCQEAALYVTKGDLAGTAEALEQLLADTPDRARLLAAAPTALANYQWPRAADATLELIEACGIP